MAAAVINGFSHPSTSRSSALVNGCKFSSSASRLAFRRLRRPCAAAAGDAENLGWDADEYGPYPWNQTEKSAVEWVPQDMITLFTSEGIVRIGGSTVPRPRTSSKVSHQLSSLSTVLVRLGFQKQHKLRRFREEDYMDPKQGLCLGALFDIAATNGLDMGRRFCILGFCRSIEMLSDVVEEAVLEQGGEVVVAAKFTSGDLHEKLKMRVAIPLLWGVPPGLESLNHAIRSGGGIVERSYYRWEFF